MESEIHVIKKKRSIYLLSIPEMGKVYAGDGDTGNPPPPPPDPPDPPPGSGNE